VSPSQYRRVIGDAHAVVQPRHGVSHVTLVDDAVRVAVDVGVIADRDIVAEGDSAAVIQQNVPVNDNVVAHFHVVPE